MNTWHKALMESFYAACDYWKMLRENETALYAGDISIWEANNPRPQLREFMIASRNNY